jgi:Domain of unknown function (DUF4340)
MKPRTVLVLVVLGVVALVGGWYLGPGSTPGAQVSVASGQLAFPDLAPKLQDAARVEIEQKGKTLVIEKHGDHWGVADRGDYPIQESKLRGILTGLTELRLVDKRTALPSELGQLGVDDPSKPNTEGLLLRVLDGKGQPIAALILGHRRVLTGGDVPEEIYVRRPGDNQSWLAEGTLDVDADPSLWLDRDIANIDNSKIAGAEVVNGTDHLTFGRVGGKFVLTAPAAHPKLDDFKIEDVSRAFEYLTFNDVKPGPLPGTLVGTSTFTTTDGMTIDTTVNRNGKDIWASFEAKGGKDAAAIAQRVKGWAYQLGSWKQAALAPSLTDLEQVPPAPGSAPAAPAAAPSPDQ